MKHRTSAYWPTRITLAVGLIATAAVVLVARSLIYPELCFGCDYQNVLGLPSNVLVAALAVALALFGLVWMLRIFFRGRRNDESHAWRYRDR